MTAADVDADAARCVALKLKLNLSMAIVTAGALCSHLHGGVAKLLSCQQIVSWPEWQPNVVI